MHYRYLGRTGIQVSALCMGTMTFGREADRAMSAALFARCREAGINFFDCANIYADGESERILGSLVAGCRDEVVITSKGHFPTGPDRNARGSSRRHLTTAVDASLKRLNTDRIDLYFLHHFDVRVPLEETLAALDDLVHAGKLLHIGASNFAAWQVEKALGIAERRGWARLACIQPMYNLLKRQAEVEILPMARAENLGVVIYSPLAGGILTGKYLDKAAPATGRLLTSELYQRRYADAQIRETARGLTALARANGVHPATLAVAWTARHPAVTAPIIGARNLEQLEPSLQAATLSLTPELTAAVAALSQTPPPATDRSEEAGT